MYRGTWLLVGIPLLVAAFTVARARSRCRRRRCRPPSTAPPRRSSPRELANELSRTARPGSPGAHGPRPGSPSSCASTGLTTRGPFHANDPRPRRRASSRTSARSRQGRSNQTRSWSMAHRDNAGAGPGANDNASGTAALIELARSYARAARRPPQPPSSRTHTIVFLSTDGGAFGGLGAARFAARSPYRDRVVAVVNLDAIGGRRPAAARVRRRPPAFAVRGARARRLPRASSSRRAASRARPARWRS